MEKVLVENDKFSIRIVRGEKYDLLVGKVVNFLNDSAQEDTPVKYVTMFSIDLYFVRNPKVDEIPGRKEDVNVSIAVSNRVSKGFEEFLLNEIGKLKLPLGKSVEIMETTIRSFPTFYDTSCSVEIFVKIELKTEMKTTDIYKTFRPAAGFLESAFQPLFDLVKRKFVEDLTKDGWFERLITEEIPIYRKKTKFELFSARTVQPKVWVWFGEEPNLSPFSIIKFEVPVPKETGDLFMGKTDEYEIISYLIFYVSVRGEGPYKFDGEKVPLTIKEHNPTADITFPIDRKKLILSLTNYLNYGLEGRREELYK